ncbi:MAG TPA: hypothetical protein VH643_32960 [Gemmataceae bacterium]|jgi:hypothetical protein
MKRLLSPRLGCLVVLVCVFVVSGCGKKLPPMAPISGKVTVDGQPVSSGQVVFVPDVKVVGADKPIEQSTAGLSAGQIADGEYKISTSGKDGAPVGKYKVIVTPSMMPTGDAKKMPASGFNKAYSDPNQTPLKFEVVASPEPGRYDLKLRK